MQRQLLDQGDDVGATGGVARGRERAPTAAGSARESSRGLSPREAAIARRIASGESHKVVASAYSISVQAVSTYLRRAKSKLGVRSRPELIRALDRARLARAPVDPRPERRPDERLGSSFSALSSVNRSDNGRWRLPLTATEASVLADLLDGMSNAEIARARGVSKRTIAAHASAIIRKAGVQSRAELLAHVLAAPHATPIIAAASSAREEISREDRNAEARARL